jgi:RHS repeat-associated protein
MTDANGHRTDYEYDLAGNLVKTTFADGTFTTRTYDAINRLASVTDERGNRTTYEYANCGCSDRVTKVTDPLGRSTVTTYDANGRKSSVTDANGKTTNFTYNVRGQLVQTDYPDGTSTTASYDSRGRRASTTDQTGATTLYGYDDQAQLTSITDPAGNVTRLTYDLDGNITAVADAKNHTTTFEYDLMNRLTKRTRPAGLPGGQSETFTYDAAGRPVVHTDFQARTTAMTYDSRDRLLTKTPLGAATQSYSYSPTGKRTSMTDASGTTTYGYDVRDRLITKAAPAGTLTYGYDAAGNVATIRSSNANGTSIDYGWDAANQLVSVADNRAGGTTAVGYTGTRRPSSVVQPNGSRASYSYDSLDRVVSMMWRDGTGDPLGSWDYTHNARGQRTSATQISGRRATYGYDAASRLTSEAVTGDPRGDGFNGAVSYELDGVGNRLSRTSTLAALGAQSFSYNANDELASDGYDLNGNTVSSDGHSYAYDFDNRLVSKDGATVALQYNCDGHRVAKTVGGVTTQFIVDDLNPTGYLQVLEEVVGGAVQTRYTYGTSLVSQTRNVSSTPATSYYGYDAPGNVTFLTDASGSITDTYDYDAWGILLASVGTTPNSRRYAGEEFDADLGLTNLRARQYGSSVGRFLTLDPLINFGRQGALNPYSYTNIDPVNQIDPSGKIAAYQYAIIISIVTNVIQTAISMALRDAGYTRASDMLDKCSFGGNFVTGAAAATGAWVKDALLKNFLRQGLLKFAGWIGLFYNALCVMAGLASFL